ncbi:hypothetical protein [Nocardioides pelophilus]|uniref:hypothetical protein n=1 Tax=Nocardioides pelophilus TaxID=2172019 RepID=UPI001601A15A|nr:hypothetical protein [Nocardioides pelophilus]
MLHRRSTATLVAALLPLAAALTSCGFDYPTDRVNTIAAGVNNRDASVEVLGARVVAYADGQGRLIGTLVNSVNDAEEPAVLDAVQGEAGSDIEVTVSDVEIPGNERVNLASDEVGAVVVTGDFSAGDVVTLTYSFSTDELVTLDVPVVKPCGQYADITAPELEPEAAEEEPAEAEDAEAAAEEADATYLCDHPTENAEGEEGGH